MLDFLKIAVRGPAGMRVSADSGFGRRFGPAAGAGADLARGYGFEKCISAQILPVAPCSKKNI